MVTVNDTNVVSDPVIRRFIESAIRPLKKEIYTAYIFGSRIRDDWRPDSDYDIMIVLHKKKREIIDKLYDAVMDILLETGQLVSLKIFSLSEFNRLSSIPTPFIKNILSEGARIG